MNTILLITNRRLDESHGRSETFRSRKEQLKQYGWEIEVGFVDVEQGIGPSVPLSDIMKVYNTMKKKEIDIIHSISEPVQLHLVGFILNKLSNKPWLAELRDPIVTRPSIDPRSSKASLRKIIEKHIFFSADKIVWVNGIQLPQNYIEKNYPTLPPNRYERIPGHGIELDKIETIVPTEYDSFTLSYAGSFYDGWIEPKEYIAGVKEYMDRYNDREIQLQFFGDWCDEYQQIVNKYTISNNVQVHDWIEPAKLLNNLAGSDGLVYIGGTDSRNSRNIPSKLYDYMAVQKPIVAIIDPTFRAANFVKSNKAGIVVPQDRTEIAEAIHLLKNNQVPSASDKVIKQYSRKKSVDRLVEIYSTILE